MRWQKRGARMAKKKRANAKKARKRRAPEDIERDVLAGWAVYKTYAGAAREAGCSPGTAKKIILAHAEDKAYQETVQETQAALAERIEGLLDKALILFDRKITRALEGEDVLETAIREIADDESIKGGVRADVLNKLRSAEIHRLSDVTTAIGTLYDKRALARGEATENTRVTVDLPEDIEKYAG